MKPEYIPETYDQKMGYLVEECGEVLSAVGKTLRWGPDSVNPELPRDRQEMNGQWVLRELEDLTRAIAFVRLELESRGYFICRPS